jgi:hypothetical protein
VHGLWTCDCCGKLYTSLPFAFALDEPDPWRSIPEAERGQRGFLTTDRCVIDATEYCIRARLEVPVLDAGRAFVWGLWVSLSKASYDRIGALWNTPARARELPEPGALCSDIPIYPRTTGLRCKLYLQDNGRRPSIRLEPSDHPLAVEQRSGITIHRVKQIAASMQKHATT